jgi:DNA-binding transcriptional LysR family regulator
MRDLNSLIVFAHVVEANGFSKAARRLKMPTSTVSRRIADLEEQLGVRLIERSTRNLRLTDAGSEVLEHAQRSAEISEAIENIASNHLSSVSGNLRLAAPPSISDSLLAPIAVAFLGAYPDVRIQILITERIVDQIAEGVDLAFRVGELEDSSLVARRILTYRHQLVASPAYLQNHKPPKTPRELLGYRLLAFSFWRPERTWKFIHANGKDEDSITFKPYLSINEYDGLAISPFFTCPYAIWGTATSPGPFGCSRNLPRRWLLLCSRSFQCEPAKAPSQKRSGLKSVSTSK